MVSSLGSATSYRPSPAPSPSAGLQAQVAQVARYKKELSECVNCASAKTPQGQANIEAILTKISIAQARIDKTAQATKAAAEAARTMPSSPSATLGTRLDVFA